MIKIYLDVETTGIPKNKEPAKDIITQLSYIIEHNGKFIFQNEYCNPGVPISVNSMALTGIVPEMIEEKPKCKDTIAFNRLQTLLEHEDCVIYSHNALSFDIPRLKEAGLNLKDIKIVDTLKICRFINDNAMLWDSLKLGYLIYFYRLDKYRTKIAQTIGYEGEIKSHDSISDVIDLVLLTKHLEKLTDSEVQEMIKLTENPIFYNRVPYGEYRKYLMTEMNRHTLLYYYRNTDDQDLRFTILKLYPEFEDEIPF